MAVYIHAVTHAEILGGQGWAGSQAGRDRLAVVTPLNPDYFSLRDFARRRAQRTATAGEAAAAHQAIRSALTKEIQLVDTIETSKDEARWETHLEDLLKRPSKL